MDAHSFRIVSKELILLLSDAKIEKVHSPCKDITVLQIYIKGYKYRLAIRSGKKRPSCFFVTAPLSNPQTPPAKVMRLRKYLSGTRLGQGIVNFVNRSILFPVIKGGKTQDFYFIFDLRSGPHVSMDKESYLPSCPEWPNERILNEICTNSSLQESVDGAWLTYPVLTPSLRKTISILGVAESKALLVDLESGGDELFFYENSEKKIIKYSAWPFPEEMKQDIFLMSNETLFLRRKQYSDGLLPEKFPLLSSVTMVEESFFLQEQALIPIQKNIVPLKKQKKKTEKILAKLVIEEQRLVSMVELQEEAKIIQANLWDLDSSQKVDSLLLSDNITDIKETLQRTITLNPCFSIKENMERMFRHAEKGKRGLKILENRRKEVIDSISLNNIVKTELTSEHYDNSAKKELFSSLKEEKESPNKNIAKFITSDGYILYRGKNANGNKIAIKLGSPHDLWFHSNTGPSAHIVLKRPHIRDEVPESSLLEAAYLVAEKSWQKNDSKAEIMVALLKHISFIKGAPTGTVRVDSVYKTMIVEVPE